MDDYIRFSVIGWTKSSMERSKFGVLEDADWRSIITYFIVGYGGFNLLSFTMDLFGVDRAVFDASTVMHLIDAI